MRSPSAWAGYLSAKEYHITFFQNCCHFLYDAPFTNNFLYIFYVYTFNVSKCIENYTLKLPYIISLDLILNTITFYVALPSYLNKKKKKKKPRPSTLLPSSFLYHFTSFAVILSTGVVYTKRRKQKSTRTSPLEILKSRGISALTTIERVKGVFDPSWTVDGVTADTFDIRVLMKASRMSCQALLEPRREERQE